MEEVDFLLDLINRYSPTGDVDEAKGFLLDKLKEYGFNPKVLSRGAIITDVGCGEKGLILCGHLDTVRGEIPVLFDGRVISGRGVVDAKGPLATLIQALRRSANKLKTRVFLAISIDEEEESLSTLELMKTLRNKAFAAIVGEPSRTYGLTVAYYGKLDLEICCTGRRRHISSSIKFENPLERAFKTYLALKKGIFELFGEIPIAPVSVKGDMGPENECKIHVCVRYPPFLSFREVFTGISEILNESKCSYKLMQNVDPYEVDQDNWLVDLLLRCIREEGLNPKLIRKVGTCDMNLIGNILKIPTVAYGPGNPRLSHMDVERILVEDYLRSIRILERALLRIGDHYGPNDD
ncbi:hypothetical protein DRN86_04270 [Candidatus Geothermarchaeota archaeon]|nr:MAG: hypothetical protein DRN86_04270 [Candidatus Geothermarchaeota archaeon]